MAARLDPRRALRRIAAFAATGVAGVTLLTGGAGREPVGAQATTTIGLSFPTDGSRPRPSTTIGLGTGSTIPGAPTTTIDLRTGPAPGRAAPPTTVGLDLGDATRPAPTTEPAARVLGTQQTGDGGPLASTGAKVAAAAVAGAALVAGGLLLRGAARGRRHPAR